VTIVDVAPVLDEHPGFHHAAEDLAGEQLVARCAVEALHEGVLPRAARVDVGRPGAEEAAPVVDGRSHQLRPVVAADERGSTAPAVGLVQSVHDVIRRDGAADAASQVLAGVLVGHDQAQRLLGPDVFLSNGAVAPFCDGDHPASTLELADDTCPFA
jgi:hypothetical protein